MATVKVTKMNNRIYVRCPYNPVFIERIKKYKGRWDPILKMWKIFGDYTEEEIGDYVESVFGPGAFNGKFKEK